MNSLSVNLTQENGLSFELLVDEQPIGEILKDGNEGIPYWLVSDGLPTYPPSGSMANPAIRIVSVCGCGEYGCGHSRCHIKEGNGTVVFFDFEGDVGQNGKNIRFEFDTAAYRRVIETITRLRNEYQAKDG